MSDEPGARMPERKLLKGSSATGVSAAPAAVFTSLSMTREDVIVRPARHKRTDRPRCGSNLTTRAARDGTRRSLASPLLPQRSPSLLQVAVAKIRVSLYNGHRHRPSTTSGTFTASRRTIHPPDPSSSRADQPVSHPVRSSSRARTPSANHALLLRRVSRLH